MRRLGLGHARWSVGVLATLLSGWLIAPAGAEPIGRSLTIELYADVADPMTLSFSPDGTLYVGRDLSGSGGSAVEATSIHRVLTDGTVEPFGPAISDPDAVVVDVDGVIAPVANSVLVGGVDGATLRGAIHAIAPDGSSSTVFGPSTGFFNPSDMVFDGGGRLLLTDYNRNDVKASTGAAPSALFGAPSPGSIARDEGADLTYVSGGAGRIDVYAADGTLVVANLATVGRRGGLALGPGSGRFGGDLYTVGAGGELWRIPGDGEARIVASGLGQVEDLTFGPDGALYISEFDQDRILRVTPAGFVLGDMDGNGVVDAFDVDDFELALADRAAYDAMYLDIDADVVGDIDGSGGLDGFDTAPYEELLAGVGVPIPSPGGGLALALGAAVWGVCRQRETRTARLFGAT